jgi:DNA-binding NtrC family response regulator
LELRHFEVSEAEDSLSALQSLANDRPDVLITDLDMRTRTEGLDLIRQVAQNYPVLPVILISAVGTFDEGALAKEFGAMYVLSKGQAGQEKRIPACFIEKSNGNGRKAMNSR